MAKLLQVDFKYHGPFAQDMSNALLGLAQSINQEPGLIWKIWTESSQDQLGGGVYLFDNQANAEAYLAMHSARLTQMGITDIRAVILAVNETLSNINHGPITTSTE